MDAQLGNLAQAALVLAMFAAANERIIEIWRSLGVSGSRLSGWVERKWLHVVPALVIAVVAQADLLELFASGAEPPAFFKPDHYMGPLSRWLELWAAGGFWRHLAGCVMMGLSTTLGSQFWHDLAGKLADTRAQLKEVKQQALSEGAPQ